jgi:hypothetical protein
MSTAEETDIHSEDTATLQQLDDVCLVRLDGAVADPAARTQFTRRLIEFMERGGCRKLLITGDRVESIRGFLSEPASPPLATQGTDTLPLSSDLWVG